VRSLPRFSVVAVEKRKLIRSSFFSSFATDRPEDPDEEDAPVVPDMVVIELRVFRSRAVRRVDNRPNMQYGLHRGRVSERSKKAGWHHVR
jgi:hypothetical protein